MVLPTMTSSLVDELRTRTGSEWPNLRRAAIAAEQQRTELAQHLARLTPSDTSIVVFGSLARDEWTAQSDVDWTLLVDGQVDASHARVTHEIRTLFARLKKNGPGPSGIFGGLAFSHELVHCIGGAQDSNRNITQRILLLLESRALDSKDVRERVLRALFNRYLADDPSYSERNGWRPRVPRFLLNDIVRYWRTVAVDFAQKRIDRPDGWGLRNIKLRISRKLTFSAGMLACLKCQLHPPLALDGQQSFSFAADLYSAILDWLMTSANRAPLETLAEAAIEYRANDDVVRDLFGSYDAFLELLDDNKRRQHLKQLDSPDQAFKDDQFLAAREIGRNFQRGLMKLFFATNEHLTQAVQEYGVF